MTEDGKVLTTEEAAELSPASAPKPSSPWPGRGWGSLPGEKVGRAWRFLRPGPPGLHSEVSDRETERRHPVTPALHGLRWRLARPPPSWAEVNLVASRAPA